MFSFCDVYNSLKTNNIGFDSSSHISDSVSYGLNCYIGAFAFVGSNVKIGNDVKIFPNVYIGDNVIIGNNTTLRPRSM